MDIVDIIMQITVLVFAVIVHEVSHGYVAYRLGDPTAKEAGRLTLNPLPHIDPFWSILLPVLCVITHQPVFGAAKPVPVDARWFKNPKKDMMLVSFAGPGSNIIMAVAGIIFFVIVAKTRVLVTPGVLVFLQYVIIINLMLAVLNLMPIPPLDGSHILVGFLPDDLAYKYLSVARYGIVIVLILAYMGAFSLVFNPIYIGVIKLLNFLT